MPYSISNPPDRIGGLPKHAQEIWIAAFNSALEQYKDEERANKVAWAAVKQDYEQDADGNWHAKKSLTDEGLNRLKERIHLRIPVRLKLKQRKAISDAPNLRGDGQQSCANCKFFEYLPPPYSDINIVSANPSYRGICSKYEFETDGTWVCDSWAQPDPMQMEPIPVTVVKSMKDEMDAMDAGMQDKMKACMKDKMDGGMGEEEAFAMCKKEMSPEAKSINPDETVIAYGDEIKALGNGKLGGYLVRYGSPSERDLTGVDWFSPKTDFGDASKSDVYFHHGLPVTIKRNGKKQDVAIRYILAKADLKRDEVGIFAETILDMRNEYEQMLYGMAAKSKLAWSSGTAPHLVVRDEDTGEILKWPLGLDASLTPTPAEPRNLIAPLKALKSIELSDAASDIATQAPAQAPGAKAGAVQDGASGNQPPTDLSMEGFEMNEEERKALIADILAAQAEATKTAVNEAVKPINEQLAALKAQPPTNGGGLAGPKHNKTPLGDDAYKAFGWYLKTGDASGIRTGEAFDQMLADQNSMKTTYSLLESTQYQGQEAVPTEVVAKIIEKRDPISVARRGGSQVIAVGSNAFVLPIEKASPENFVITTITGSATFDQTTVQPLDKLSGTIYLFTKSVPIDMQLLDDSVFGIEDWWTRRMGRAWGLTENTYFLMGTGSSQPQGAVYGSTLGVTAASGTAVTAAEIVDLYHKVPAEYRDRVCWVMRGATEGAVRKLTVSTQFPFVGQGGANGGVGTSGLAQGQGWLVSPAAGVYNSDGMDALAVSKKPIFCGNLEAGYVIAERKGLTVFRDPYTLAVNGMVNILAYFRETGGVANATALYNLTTPSA